MKAHARWMTGSPSVVTALRLTALGLLPWAAQAANLYWDAGGAPSTNWATVANWDTAAGGGGDNPGSAPGASDIAVFNVSGLNSTQTALVDSSPLALQGLVVNNTGNTYLESLLNPRLTLGSGGITINAGAGLLQFGSGAQNHRFSFGLSADQTWKNNSASPLAFVNQNGVDNAGFLLTIDGTGNFTTGTGAFGGTGGLTKNGSGTFATGAAHNFTGPLTVNAGILNSTRTFATTSVTINGGTLIGTTFANVGLVSSIGAGSAAADLVFGGGTLTYNVAAVASTDRLITIGNANGLTATINSSANLVANALSFTGTGALGLGGSGARILTLTGSNAGANTFRPVIGDGAGGATALVKSGAGAWTLSGANTYTGGTTLSAGTLKLSGSGTLGASSGALAFSGGTLDLGATSQSVGAVTASAGCTIVNGTLTCSSCAVQGAVLQLDYSGASSPRTNMLVATQGLSLTNGGTLHMKGAAGLSSSQSFSGLTFGPGLSHIWNQPNGGTSNVLSLGAIAAAGAGSGLFIVNTANGVVSTSTANDATGLFSGRVVYKDSSLNWAYVNFATRNSDGSIGTNGNVITVSAGGSFTPVTGANYNIVADADVLLASDATVNSLRVSIPGTTRGLNLNGHLLTLSSGGVLLAAEGNYDYTLKNGRLTAGGGNELIFNQYSRNVLTCNAQIVDNGNPVAVTLVGTNNMAAGLATLTVGTNNTYSGGTYISNGSLLATSFPQALGSGIVVLNGGKLRLDKSLAIGGNLSGRSGSIIELGTNTLTVTQGGDSTFAGSIVNTGAVVKAGAGALTFSGANTYAGGTTVEAGTLLVCNSSGSGTGTNRVAVTDDATLGGTGAVAGSVAVEDDGTLAAGLFGAAGTLTVSNLTFAAGSTFAVNLASDTSADRVVATGAVALDGALVVTPVGEYVPDVGTEWTILTGTVASGTFSSVTPGYEVDVGASSVVLRCVAGGKATILLVR